MNADMNAWLETRPESVRRLAREFPIGSAFEVDGRTKHLVGYTEDDRLLVSEVDPAVDYRRAFATKEHLCASHVRRGDGRVIRGGP